MTNEKRKAPAYADQIVAARAAGDEAASEAARATLVRICRRSGVDPELLIAEAERRARFRAEPELPPVPAAWRRLLRLPRTLAGELLSSIERRWRLRRFTTFRPGALTQAWWRTDPWYRLRAIEDLRGIYTHTAPATVPAPTPGTEITLTGALRVDAKDREDLLLNGVSLDRTISSALKLDPSTSAFCAQITVRILNEPNES